MPPFEINEHGFSLSGKNYFDHFKSLATDFIRQQHVVMFKFDGIGAGTRALGAGPEYRDDMRSLLRFILALRETKPDIYLSLTVGTWASPFFLMYGNNIWRGGDDYNFTGAGNKRQQWLNYRDRDTYEGVVRRSNLYPLNAVMNHGIMIAGHGEAAVSERDDRDISDDIWMFFGGGTSLQELYINPHQLNARQWDMLADAVQWSQAHRDVLADVHWTGGDPADGQVYGFAAWNPEHGTLTLRNPSEKTQSHRFSLKEVLELPAGFAGEYRLFNVVNNTDEGTFDSETSASLTLQPFEVKVMNVEKSHTPFP
jgi:hypothetical protein